MTTKARPSRPLAKAAISLSTIGLGGASLGGNLRKVSDQQAHETVIAAWEAGIRYFDTAPFYGYGASELRFGAALRSVDARDAVLSTKVGRLLRPRTQPQTADDTWVDPLPFEQVYDYTAAGILRSFEDSQQRLGTDRIDILLVHDIGVFQHGTRNEHYWRQLTEGGGFQMLDELRRSGRVAAIGLGVNECAVVLRMMDALPIDCVLLAGRYTLLEQDSLPTVMTRCVSEKVSVIVGGPFNSGILVDPNARDATYNYARADETVVRRARQLATACERFGVPLPAAALQFVLAHPAVVSCIPGPRDPGELTQILAWADLPIDPELWRALRRDGLIADGCPAPSTDAVK